MKSTKRMLLAGLLAATLALAPHQISLSSGADGSGARVTVRVPLALALQNNGSGDGTEMDKLKEDGYSCVRVSVNFIECTKDGKPTHWCTDAGDCEQKARKAPRGGRQTDVGTTELLMAP